MLTRNKQQQATGREGKEMNININKTSIETGLWAIERYLIKHYGTAQAARDMAPIIWYINTGRASCDYLRDLLSAKPFVIARALHKGGSYDDALARVRAKI